MTVFDVTLTTLSPMHIGDGNELRQDFDYSVHSGRTYVLNIDGVLRGKEHELRDSRGGYILPGKLLTSDQDFKNGRYFRYVLPGTPRSEKTDSRMQPFIKDHRDVPYIPGSSLKGALRTALAWAGWDEVKPDLSIENLKRSPSWAGQNIEGEIFGKTPNNDLLKVLQVSDLTGLEKPGEGLVLVNAQVLTKKGAESPVELEALRGDVKFNGTIKIDDVLFSSFAENKLHFSKRKHWFDELMLRVQSHSYARIEALAEWFDQTDPELGATKVAKFYHQLYDLKVGDNQALIQLGWGIGWDGTTFWTYLQEDEYLFEDIVNMYGLHRGGQDALPRRPGDPFPRSKRAAMSIKSGKAQPLAPFGWALLEMNERD